MNAVVLVLDASAFALFCAALVVLATVPTGRPTNRFGTATKWFAMGAVGIFALTPLADLLERGRLSVLLEPVEPYLPLLVPPFLMYAAYSHYARRRLIDAQQTERQLRRTYQLLENIVEVTPAGIMVLDDAGRITWANGTARRVLDLEEEDGTAAILTPGWTVWLGTGSADPYDERPDFAALVTEEPLRNVDVTVRWPTGWRRHITITTAPMESGDGRIGGVVVAFGEGCA